MRCPFCQSVETKVVDKREAENCLVTRRRRECLKCSKRFTTYERIELVNLYILKKDGTKQLFDPSKIERGIMRACEKRPVSVEQIKRIIQEIELMLKNRRATVIPSKQIGTMVMTRLKRLDKVAYIRFASVYREFKDIDELADEVDRMRED
jgi:transcriptional repressor NrdR